MSSLSLTQQEIGCFKKIRPLAAVEALNREDKTECGWLRDDSDDA